MAEEINKYKVKLPASFTKKYKSKKLIDAISDDGMWVGRPLPTTPEGRKILKFNEPLFDYCESIDGFDYAFEPVMGTLVELVPPHVSRQGIGISVDPIYNALELDVYFFPCDYSADEKRDLPFMYVRQSVVTVGDAKQIDGIVKQYFPDPFEHKDSAVIPFSLDRFAELEGDFIDDYKNTEKICRAAVKGGDKYELKNCDNFLSFIKTAGLE